MASRPWVTPQQVKDYSEIAAVQNRTEARLAVDISRAEQYVITATHNTFENYDTIPEPIATAVLILAEAYAHNAVVVSRDMKSETLDDYSYTAENSSITLESLDLSSLLDGYIIDGTKQGVTMRMRRL